MGADISKEDIKALDRALSLALEDDDIQFMPTEMERQAKFKEILQSIMPYLESDERKIITAEILITLKLEGVIGKEFTEKDAKMVHILKDAIMKVPEKKREALRYAYALLR